MNIVNEAKKLTDMYRGWKFNDIMNAANNLIKEIKILLMNTN